MFKKLSWFCLLMVGLFAFIKPVLADNAIMGIEANTNFIFSVVVALVFGFSAF